MPKTYITRESRELNIIFGNLIGERKLRKVSQEKIADAIGLTRQGYSRIEEKQNMTLEQFLAVCHEIGIKPSEALQIAERD